MIYDGRVGLGSLYVYDTLLYTVIYNLYTYNIFQDEPVQTPLTIP
jgi:hypothetical protein